VQVSAPPRACIMASDAGPPACHVLSLQQTLSGIEHTAASASSKQAGRGDTCQWLSPLAQHMGSVSSSMSAKFTLTLNQG
jgi:hypothetical protein